MVKTKSIRGVHLWRGLDMDTLEPVLNVVVTRRWLHPPRYSMENEYVLRGDTRRAWQFLDLFKQQVEREMAEG